MKTMRFFLQAHNQLYGYIEVHPMTIVVQEDFIGLKELDKGGRLELGSLPGYHMQFSLEEFNKKLIQPYLTRNETRAMASR